MALAFTRADGRKRADEMRQQRESLATTLRETPIGTLLIDQDYFPWVVDTNCRRIEDKLDPLYPVHRFGALVQADLWRSRLTTEALTGQEVDELALCAVQPHTLKYLHVWARPLKNEQGHVVAASLSMVDLTSSRTIRHMPLKQRLDLIAQAIQRAGYDRVRLSRASDDGERLIGLVERGGGIYVHFEGFEISITQINLLNNTIS